MRSKKRYITLRPGRNLDSCYLSWFSGPLEAGHSLEWTTHCVGYYPMLSPRVHCLSLERHVSRCFFFCFGCDIHQQSEAGQDNRVSSPFPPLFEGRRLISPGCSSPNRPPHFFGPLPRPRPCKTPGIAAKVCCLVAIAKTAIIVLCFRPNSERGTALSYSFIDTTLAPLIPTLILVLNSRLNYRP